MEDSIFVNEAFDYAIKTYMDCKTDPEGELFNSFLVVVIRTLVFIYGELDILNPYKTKNIKGLGGLDSNLKKYGLNDTELEDFKTKMQVFYQNQSNDEIAKNSFVAIERMLILMFAKRSRHILLNNEDVEELKKLLYTAKTTNSYRKALYDRLTPASEMLEHYLNSKIYEATHDFIITEYKENTLRADAYKIAGYDELQVMKMSSEQIAEVNNKVYNFFGIKTNDLNKKTRLDSAISYYNKYGKTLTSGNGYVDMILLASVVATIMMILVIVGISIMR